MVKAKIGRPRSEKSHEAILNATRELLDETGGAGLTIEAIARRAKVGKPTIYRWWPTMADIVLDAVLGQADTAITVTPFTSLRETLGHFLRQSMQAINDGGGVHLRYLMAQAQQDDAFRARFRDNFVSKRRAALLSIFQEAVRHRAIPSGQDAEILVDMVFGAMWYRLLVGHAPMDAHFADELTELIGGMTQAPPSVGMART